MWTQQGRTRRERGGKLPRCASDRQRRAFVRDQARREKASRARVLSLVEKRQEAARADLALSLWRADFPGANPGDRRWKGRFIRAAPKAGVWS